MRFVSFRDRSGSIKRIRSEAFACFPGNAFVSGNWTKWPFCHRFHKRSWRLKANAISGSDWKSVRPSEHGLRINAHGPRNRSLYTHSRLRAQSPRHSLQSLYLSQAIGALKIVPLKLLRLKFRQGSLNVALKASICQCSSAICHFTFPTTMSSEESFGSLQHRHPELWLRFQAQRDPSAASKTRRTEIEPSAQSFAANAVPTWQPATWHAKTSAAASPTRRS
jgi:hypothetical protein